MKPLVSSNTDTALVFEGGGMRASFSSGVLAVLLEAGIFCDWVGGISAGSSCTVNYLSRDVERAAKTFVDFADNPKFGGWRSWAQGKGLFSAEYIYEQTSLPGQALPYDWDAFQANPARCRIGGFRCDDGEMVYWDRDDLDTRTKLMKRVRASSTMPLLMPITDIDGVDYCDGALGPTGGFAVDAARDDGFDKFLVVMTRERGYRKPRSRLTRAYPALFRRYPAIALAMRARPGNYNRTLDELLELERAGKAYLVFPDEMPIGNSERNVTKLAERYAAGRAQAQRELGAIQEFLA